MCLCVGRIDGTDSAVTVWELVSVHFTMADGGSDDDVIHLASFNVHRSQGETHLHILNFMHMWSSDFNKTISVHVLHKIAENHLCVNITINTFLAPVCL